MPTPISDEIRRMTTDPGARRLAQYLDSVMQRLDTCCPPPAPLAAEPKKEDK